MLYSINLKLKPHHPSFFDPLQSWFLQHRLILVPFGNAAMKVNGGNFYLVYINRV